MRDGVNTPTIGVRRVFPKCLKGVIHRLKFIPVKSHKCLTFYGYESHTESRHTITKFRLLFLPFRWQFCCRHILRCEKLQYAFPICDDPSLIGYHITKMSFNKLGEGNCLKIIIDHYRDNYQKIKEISQRRGTNMKVLMESYNINYNIENDTSD